MGLFHKLVGSENAARRATDDVLLLHSLLLMAAADGVIQDGEIMALQGFVSTLPELRGKDFKQLFEQARGVCARYETPRESVNALADIQSEAVKKKCFILAVDMAFASGNVDRSEEELLEAMQRVLGVSDDLAAKTLEVFALKYAL